MAARETWKLRRLRPVQILTYLLVRAVIATLTMFPLRTACRIGRFLGRVLHALDARHRAVARENVRLATGLPKEARAIDRFVRDVYEHFGLGFVEILMTPKVLQRGELSRLVRLEDWHHMERALAARKGVIVVIAHQGNWEWGGMAVTKAGYPLNSVARPIENPWLDRYLNRFRTLTGQRIIPKYNALKEMVRVLKRGEMLAILADQDVRHGGEIVPFFGRPASTIKSPALLALRHGSLVVPVDVHRDDGGISHVRATEAVDSAAFADREDPVASITRALTERLESFIRRHPTQWTWMHARWKTGTKLAQREATPALSREP